MPKDKNDKPELNLKNYKTDNNVSLSEMRIGLWFSEKRAFLTHLLIIFLILISAIFFIYSAYQFFLYFKNNSDQSSLSDTNLTSPRNLITELKIDPPQFFKNGDRYDLVAKVTNPNDKFSAKFKACFNLSGVEFSCVDSFALPSEAKYIFSLAQDIKDEPKTLSFSVKDITWQRIDAHAISNWANFSADHLNFSFADINFYSLNNNDVKNDSNILEFNVKNLSSYSYYDLPLNIALFNGGQLVGVNIYYLSNFLSGETHNIKINWPGNYHNVRVEIIPNLNILDDSVYLKYQGLKKL